MLCVVLFNNVFGITLMEGQNFELGFLNWIIELLFVDGL